MNLVMYSYPWCDICTEMWPVIKKAAAKYGVPATQVDPSTISIDIVRKHSVRNIPTFVILEDDAILDRVEGAFSEAQAYNWIADVTGATLDGERKNQEDYNELREYR